MHILANVCLFNFMSVDIYIYVQACMWHFCLTVYICDFVCAYLQDCIYMYQYVTEFVCVYVTFYVCTSDCVCLGLCNRAFVTKCERVHVRSFVCMCDCSFSCMRILSPVCICEFVCAIGGVCVFFRSYV